MGESAFIIYRNFFDYEAPKRWETGEKKAASSLPAKYISALSDTKQLGVELHTHLRISLYVCLKKVATSLKFRLLVQYALLKKHTQFS